MFASSPPPVLKGAPNSLEDLVLEQSSLNAPLCSNSTSTTRASKLSSSPFLKSLKQSFNFRTWEQDSDMEYCRATIHRPNEHHHELHHSKYFFKLKPISFEDGPDTQPVTDKQRTMLRATIGASQWPATQSSPDLQAMVSQVAGQVSNTLATLREANKYLRYAKSNCDVGFRYQKLGQKRPHHFVYERLAEQVHFERDFA